ncbi:MAG: redoxin domain-containing protein [Armatimonadota bacterium]
MTHSVFSRRALLVAVPLVAAAGVARWRHTHRPVRDFHGGVDTALLATSDQLDAIAPGDQLGFLLGEYRSADPARRFAAFEHLVDRTEPEVVDVVRSGIHDNFSRIRQRSVERLVHLNPRFGWELLVAALSDEDDWVREAAANQCALLIGRPAGKSAPANLVPSLVQAVADPSAAVRSGACTALRKLAGKSGSEWRLRSFSSPAEVGAVARRWRKWLAARPEANLPLAPSVPPSRIDPGPEFSISGLDGAIHASRALRGRPVVVHFWGTWCGPCVHEMPDLEAVHRRRGDSVHFVGVAVAEKGGADSVRDWTRRHGITFPQALATDATTEAFGDIREVPVTFLLDGQGRLRRRWDGERLGQAIDDAITAVLG